MKYDSTLGVTDVTLRPQLLLGVRNRLAELRVDGVPLSVSGIMNATEKSTMPVQDWPQALSQLAIYFEGRLNEKLGI